MVAMAQVPEKLQSTLEVFQVRSGEREIIYQKQAHFEAPNWSPDGQFFIINTEGKLNKIDRETLAIKNIPFDVSEKANNDHGISPDGKSLVISSSKYDARKEKDNHNSVVFTLPIEGGKLKRITNNAPSYWHGWSPDGKQLAFVGERNGQYDIYAISAKGGKEIQLTNAPGLDDGPEYSPNGKYIYYNSFKSGVMEIWRMEVDGSNQTQLTNDEHSNWFPHISPDGKSMVYICYLEDQKQDHPFGKDVKLRVMDLESENIKDLTEVFYGGQGTMNVPSWSPDSKEIAFVSYKDLGTKK